MKNWYLAEPVDAVIFDCDGTLSSIEGIDFLAEQNGVGLEVKQLTEEAMSQKGLTTEVFSHRLDLVKPTSNQVNNLGKHYFENCIPGIKNTIAILQHLKKSIYIISSGLLPAVKIFGSLLNIPSKNIFAVDVIFDSQGFYKSFDINSPLINNEGKKIIVADLLQHNANLAYIGDGLNDLSVLPLVTRFIGYGGLIYREKIASQAHFYITNPSIASLLPLVLTPKEVSKLTRSEKIFYDFGKKEIEEGI